MTGSPNDFLEVLMQAQQFYEKCGFKAVSKPYDLYGISHLKMGYTE